MVLFPITFPFILGCLIWLELFSVMVGPAGLFLCEPSNENSRNA
jgi:hypothetical protein